MPSTDALQAEPANATSAPGARPSVLVWQWGYWGAGPRFAAEMAAALEHAGFDTILSLSENGEAYPGLSTLCARHLDFKGRGPDRSGARVSLGLPAQLFHLWRRLRRQKPNLAICAMQGYWDLPFAVVLKLMGVRVVPIVHEVKPHPGDIHPAQYALQKLFARLSDAVIVLSEAVAADARKAWPRKTVVTAFHPPFGFADLGLPAARPLTVPEMPLRVLVAGRMWRYKGIELALAALKKLPPGAVRLRIVGSGAALAEGQVETAQGAEIENRWLSEAELVAEIDHADIVLFPYVEASQSGLVPLSLSRARPALVTPVGGLREQVEDGVDGRVASAATDEAIAGILAGYVDRPDILTTMSRDARAHSESARRWQDFIDCLTGLF